MKFSEILSKLDGIATENSLSTNQDPEITGLAAIDTATSGTLSYVENAKFASLVDKTRASALILPQDKTLQLQVQ